MFRRRLVQSRQMIDALVGHVPAAAQVESAQSSQAPRAQQQAVTRDVTAATQLEHSQLFEVTRYATQTVVSHLFAQAQVQLGDGRQVLHDSVTETDVRHVVAAAQIQALQFWNASDDVAEAAA